MKNLKDIIAEKLKLNKDIKINNLDIDAVEYLANSLLNTIFVNYHLTKDSFKENNGLCQPKEYPTHFDYYVDFMDEINIYKDLYEIWPYKNDVSGVRIKGDNDTCILFQFEIGVKKIRYINFSKNIKDALLDETNK